MYRSRTILFSVWSGPRLAGESHASCYTLLLSTNRCSITTTINLMLIKKSFWSCITLTKQSTGTLLNRVLVYQLNNRAYSYRQKTSLWGPPCKTSTKKDLQSVYFLAIAPLSNPTGPGINNLNLSYWRIGNTRWSGQKEEERRSEAYQQGSDCQVV